MADGFSGVFVSTAPAADELVSMTKRVDRATATALKRVTTKARSSIRSGMRGTPRWTHRGPWKDREALDIDGGTRRNPHTGGPGLFSGALMASVKKSKRPRKIADGDYVAVVMGGTRNRAVNAYKRRIEGAYPYFKPGIDKATPKLPEIWEKAWGKAVESGGIRGATERG